jgi:hypothetical protein
MRDSIFDLILKILVIPELVIVGYLLVFYMFPFLVNLSVALVLNPL